MTTFVLQHARGSEQDEDVKLIGIYSTEEAGKKAIAAWFLQSGFRDAPDGFVLSAYELDETHWTDGYVTIPSED
jgi:hypothetical protein